MFSFSQVLKRPIVKSLLTFQPFFCLRCYTIELNTTFYEKHIVYHRCNTGHRLGIRLYRLRRGRNYSYPVGNSSYISAVGYHQKGINKGGNHREDDCLFLTQTAYALVALKLLGVCSEDKTQL